MTEKISLSTMFKVYRDTHKISQAEFAARLGVRQAVISKIENGEIYSLSDDHLTTLAKLFNIDKSKIPASLRGKSRSKLTGGTSAAEAQAHLSSNFHKKLKEVITWWKEGSLSDEEFQAAKKKLLGK